MGLRNYLILAVLVALPCFGQSPIHRPVRADSCVPVHARVTSMAGAPVTGATLEILNLDTGKPMSPRSFAESVFDIPCVPPGSYRMTAKLGTVEATEDIILGEGGNDAVILRLPTEAPAGATSSASVSVAQLKVPEKALKLLQKAREKLVSKDVAAALQKVNEAIKVDVNFSAAYELRGVLDLAQQHTAEAIADLDHAVKLDSGNAMARVVLGAAFNASKRFADAVHALEAAAPLTSNAWQLHYELGKAYAGVGRYRESLASLNRALKLNPKYSPIRYARGALLMHTGHYQDAAADLNQYLHDAPNGPDAPEAKQLLSATPK